MTNQNHLSLGSVLVDKKSNEITATPRLLELIDISGALVTIDAMGRYGPKEDRRRPAEAGFDKHLVKPPSIENLQQVLADPKPTTR